MPTVNKITLIGHLGKDPELRYLSTGTEKLTMSVATSWGRKRDDGEWDNFTDWHRVEMFGERAARFVETWSPMKGDLVYVEGRMQYDSWEDDNGVKRTIAKVMALQVFLLNTKSQDRKDVPEQKRGPLEEIPYDNRNQEKKKDFNVEDPDDGLPF